MATDAPEQTGPPRQITAEPGARWLNAPRITMLAFGPVLAGFAAWAETNPWAALPIVAVWGAVWFIAELAADFIARVWAKLRDRYVDRATDWVDLWLGNLFSGHRRRYLQDLVYQHRNIDLKGLTRGPHVLNLEDVFVALSVVPCAPNDASADMIRRLPEELRGGRHRLWDFFQAGGDAAKLAILGPPGSGKTTLLRHAALNLALGRSPSPRLRARRHLPILLFLRDHAGTIAGNPDIGLDELVAACEVKRKLDIPPAWFKRQLERGRCLVMLDGLDEVADPETRTKVAGWADRQMNIHGGNRFVVTSRPYGYRDNPLAEVTVLEARPFTAGQVRDFVRKWYVADQIKSQGRDDPGVRRDAEESADDLIRRLGENPALSDLAVNPLLLTMIAMVHRSGRALPGSRAELYAEICEVALGKRQEAKGIKLDLTPKQKQAVLEPLAWHMMKVLRKREIGADKAARVITKPLKKVDPETAPKDFLVGVEQGSSLLLEREGGVYEFAHHTFQEFLAACHAQQPGLVDELPAHVRDPWWRETLRLYAARSDATPILRACMAGDAPDAPDPAALALALECREEAEEIEPQVRADLDRFVRAGLDEMDPERRRPIAEALLKVRLGRLRRLDENRSIDPELVTCAEYQLFLDEMRAKREHRQPDHWQGHHFPPGDAREPVVGLRFADALAFCDWLTEREGGGWRFRPPTAEEEAEVGASTGALDKLPWRLAAIDAREPGVWPASLSSRSDAVADKAMSGLTAADRLDHSFALALRLALNRTRDRSLALAVDHAYSRALDYTLAFARAREPRLVRALDFAYYLGPAYDLDLDLDLDRARGLARGLARNVERALDRAVDRAHAYDPGLVQVLDHARDLDLNLASDYDQNRARDLARDLARVLALALDDARAPALAPALLYTLMLCLIFELDLMAYLVRHRRGECATRIEGVEAHYRRAAAFPLAFTCFANLAGTFSVDPLKPPARPLTAWRGWLRPIVAGGRRRAAGLPVTSGELARREAGSADEVTEQRFLATFVPVYLALAFTRARLTGEDQPFEALRIVRERVETRDGGL